MKKIIFTTLGLGLFLSCFAQNSAEKKTSYYDSIVTVKATDINIDLKIDAYVKKLDSLYKNYQFKNQSVKANLIIITLSDRKDETRKILNSGNWILH